MSKYRFFYHYNKPASIAAGHNKLTVHFKKTCYIVDGVICKVPTESKNRKSQPRCVIQGYCKKIEIHGNIAAIS